jgi:signal transduction histidine kinase/class 3 adenylate cyclase/CheY-like chemotaxis protein
MKAFFLLLLQLLISTPPVVAMTDCKPCVKQGILDLRGWSDEAQPVINLSGDWDFYWEQLLEPGDFEKTEPRGKEHLGVPGGWYRHSEHPMKGYATYRLLVKLDKLQSLGLEWPTIWSASRIYIDGALITSIGRVGPHDDPQHYEPEVRNGRHYFKPTKLEFDIVVQVASFEIFVTGIASTPRLGTVAGIESQREREIFTDAILIGSILIMAIYHFCLFALRTEAKSTLYFGLICLTSALYLLAASARTAAIIFPWIGFGAFIQLFNSWIPGVAFFALLTRELFPDFTTRRFVLTVAGIILPFQVFVLFAEPRTYVDATQFIQVLTFIVSVICLTAVIKAARARQDGSMIYLIAILLFTASAVHDMVMASGRTTYQSYPLGPVGMFGFICFQSVLLARRFAKAFFRAETSEAAVRQMADELKIERDQIKELNRTLEERVYAQTREIRTILETVPVGILTLEGSRLVVGKDYSRYLEAVVGQENLTGRSGPELLKLDTMTLQDSLRQTIGSDIELFDAERLALPREMALPSPRLGLRDYEVRWSVLAPSDGRIDRILVTLSDVTAIRALERRAQKRAEELQQQRDQIAAQRQALEEAHEALKKLDREKTHFFQNISHELRTPLTLILSSVKEKLQVLPQDSELLTADRHARRLLRLVNQLLDFQKISQGAYEMELGLVRLDEFIRSCLENFHSICQSKGIQFQYAGSAEAHTLVMGQTDALEKMLFNYLSNAMKYTPQGGSITVRLEPGLWTCRVVVEDTGPGLDGEDQKKLFKVFSQVDGSDRRSFEGSGLGLALVKELADKMQGAVGVESSKGRGAAFWFELPCVLDGQECELLILSQSSKRAQEIQQSLQDKSSIERFRVCDSMEQAQSCLSTQRVFALLDADGHDAAALESLRALQEQTQFFSCAANAPAPCPDFMHPCAHPFLETDLMALERATIPRGPATQRAVHDLLIVDDDPVVLMTLLRSFDNQPQIAAIASASSVKEAKTLLRKYRFRAVLADANLGHEHGWHLLEHVLMTEPNSKRFLVTGDRSTTVLGEAINRSKVDHLFYKPVDIREMQKVVLEAVMNSCLRTCGAEVNAWGSPRDWHLADLETPAEAEDTTRIGELPPIMEGQVVVCDDLRDMRSMIRKGLEQKGFVVHTAENGKAGLDLIRKVKPDLVITDWMMPVMSGPELIEAMHQEPEFSGIPTVLLTAKSDDESRILATQKGATAYLGKPFDVIELQSLAKNLMDLKRSERKVIELNRFLTEKVLQRFLPPQMVEDIIAGRTQLDEQARTSNITVLFSDLVGFTRASENLGPRKMSRLLNEFLDEMTKIVYQHQGTIDKFIGDAIMVLFGAPQALSPVQQAQLACDCAVAMQNGLQKLNQKWAAENIEAFAMRIGIHSGPCIVGTFGNEMRSEYTAIGSTVNTASRIEGVAESNAIYISQTVRDSLDHENWTAAGNFELKGIGLVPLFRLSPEKPKQDAA